MGQDLTSSSPLPKTKTAASREPGAIAMVKAHYSAIIAPPYTLADPGACPADAAAHPAESVGLALG